MPIYIYKCKDCGESTELMRRMSQAGDPVTCTCGGETGRDFGGECAGAGNKEYGETKYSQSLAISPTQFAEHKRLFPDVKIREDGCIGFDSVQQHDAYLKKTGFYKHPQRIRRKGKKSLVTK